MIRTKGQMPNILIVEDEKHLADGLRFNLEAEGYKVETVADGESALDRLLSTPRPKSAGAFDAMVLDVMLPGQDGFSVAQKLRTAGQHIPILMLTARGRSEDVLRGFEAGADDYLPKPFELKILIARLRSLLRRKNWGSTGLDVSALAPRPTEERPANGEKNVSEIESFSFAGRVFR